MAIRRPLRPPPLTGGEILPRLAEAPSRVASLTADLAPEELRTRPAFDEWSANEVLAHLRASADVWGGNIDLILAEERPAYAGVEPHTITPRTGYADEEFQPSFRAFARQRAALVKRLEALRPHDWERAAEVTAWGQVYEHTVLYYANRLSQHERSHLKQLAEVVAWLAEDRR